MPIIAVGSKNPTKINSVFLGYQQYRPADSYTVTSYSTLTIPHPDTTTQPDTTITILGKPLKTLSTTHPEVTTPDVLVLGFEVDSNVSAQPFSAKETLTGARNRRNNVKDVLKMTLDYVQYCEEQSIPLHPELDDLASPLLVKMRQEYAAAEKSDVCYAVGVEGGIEAVDDVWLESGYIVTGLVGLHYNQSQQFNLKHSTTSTPVDDSAECVGTSSRFQLAEFVIDELKTGKELCDVANRLSTQEDVRSTSGYMGLITNNLLQRTNAYVHGVIFAFSRFLNDEKQYWWRNNTILLITNNIFNSQGFIN